MKLANFSSINQEAKCQSEISIAEIFFYKIENIKFEIDSVYF